jgi:hypothetical protein
MSLRPQLGHIIDIDGIQFMPADEASVARRNPASPEVTPGGSSGKSAGRTLELNFQCELAKPPLIVVAARS